jgi:hypothetical protein
MTGDEIKKSKALLAKFEKKGLTEQGVKLINELHLEIKKRDPTVTLYRILATFDYVGSDFNNQEAYKSWKNKAKTDLRAGNVVKMYDIMTEYNYDHREFTDKYQEFQKVFGLNIK